jgi:NAD(P)-dependent dehydrogenase (short-subunit alcohol dehydrogenase family)
VSKGKGSALLIGNSDGIGLAATKRLLERDWNVAGISRSPSAIEDERYDHRVADVSEARFTEVLESCAGRGRVDLCIYCAGIGELLNLGDMGAEARVIDVNLTGMVRTAAVVIPMMVQSGRGHFMGLSSLADDLVSGEAPSYHASKAGFSNYLDGLARAVAPHGVHVTSLRFGFVDTKMARGDVRPMMMSVERAVRHIEHCMKKRPRVHTAPRGAIPLVKFRKIMMKLNPNIR